MRRPVQPFDFAGAALAAFFLLAYSLACLESIGALGAGVALLFLIVRSIWAESFPSPELRVRTRGNRHEVRWPWHPWRRLVVEPDQIQVRAHGSTTRLDVDALGAIAIGRRRGLWLLQAELRGGRRVELGPPLRRFESALTARRTIAAVLGVPQSTIGSRYSSRVANGKLAPHPITRAQGG